MSVMKIDPPKNSGPPPQWRDRRLLSTPRLSGAISTDRPCNNNSGEIAMAASLTSVVMQFLTPEVIGQVASLLGLDRAVTQQAAGGAVPALLAGLSELVESPA